MGASREHRMRWPRARVAPLLAVAGLAVVGAVVFAPATPASAVDPLTIDTPEYTPVTHSPFTFQGSGDVGDIVTVAASTGPDCVTTVQPSGIWFCDVEFVESTPGVVVTATRADDGTPAQDSEGQEYPVSLPPVITENRPGEVVSNDNPPAISGTAYPGAAVNGVIGGQACATIATATGAWTCTTAAPQPDGPIVISMRQTVASNLSDATLSTYVLDTSTTIPPFSVPVDSTGPSITVDTTDPTPTLGGAAGTAEPFGTVTVYGYNFGLTAPVHPAPDPGAFYCSDVADNVGAWACTGAAMPVGSYWVFGSGQVDLAGNGTGSPDSEFAVHFVGLPPTPPAPAVLPAVPGLKSLAFGFRVVGPDGVAVAADGLRSGDAISIEADGLPPGTLVSAEIHSTPMALGSTTVGPGGLLRLATTIPDVEPGSHEIVLTATAAGYRPATAATGLTVRAADAPGEPATPGLDLPKRLDDSATSHDIPAAAGDGPSGSGYGIDDPTEFGHMLSSPFEGRVNHFAAIGLIATGSIAIIFLLLVGFPAELLESTIRSNYDRAFGWTTPIRRRLAAIAAPLARAFANPWVGNGATILAAALLLGFADPGFGFNGASLRLLIAMILAVLVINVGLSAIVMRVGRRAFDVGSVLRPMPAALAVVAISVLMSRILDISPGFLFGIVLGVVYARELRLHDEGRLAVLGVGLTIAAGLLAFVGYGLASWAAGPGFWNNLAIESLAAITLEALGTLIVTLLPVEFLDGRTIFRWSRRAWAGLYALVAIIFVVIIVPMSDNWGSMSAPVFGWGTAFAVFAVVSIVVWALFRRRTTTSTPAAAGRPRRSRRPAPRR